MSISSQTTLLITAVNNMKTGLTTKFGTKVNTTAIGTAAAKNITVNPADPSGGADGDIWIKTAS